MKFRVLDIIIFVLLFIFVNAFPVDLFPLETVYLLIIRICLRTLLLAYYIYICVVNKINIFKFYNWKRLVLFVPFLLASCSNLIAAGIDGAYHGELIYSNDMLALLIIFHFLGAVVEEFLFRLFIQNALVKVGSLKRIFAAAGIFALMHLINIVNVSTVDALITVLIQVAYNFGLGILLGFVYEYSYSLIGCMFLHFSFNMLNTVLYQYLGCSAYTSDRTFYLTAVVIAVTLSIYTFLIYRFVLTKNERYFRE